MIVFFSVFGSTRIPKETRGIETEQCLCQERREKVKWVESLMRFQANIISHSLFKHDLPDEYPPSFSPMDVASVTFFQ